MGVRCPRSRRGGRAVTDAATGRHPSPGAPVTNLLAALHPSEGRPLPDLSDARSRSRWFVVTYVSSVLRHPWVRSAPTAALWSLASFPHPIPIRSTSDLRFSLTPEPFFPTSSPLCPGSPFLPRKLAPAPPPVTLSFALVPAARPLSPVVGGEGSGGWHPVRRCARQVKGGGARAPVTRGCERSPAFNPASGLVLNPALPAGHPGGHPRTTTSQISCVLVRADQAALY